MRRLPAAEAASSRQPPAAPETGTPLPRRRRLLALGPEQARKARVTGYSDNKTDPATQQAAAARRRAALMAERSDATRTTYLPGAFPPPPQPVRYIRPPSTPAHHTMQLLRASFRPDSDTKQAMNLQAVKLLAIDSFKQAHHKEVDGSATSDAGDQDCRRGNSAPPFDCRMSARVHANWPS